MQLVHGFQLIEERDVPEIGSRCRLWVHHKTGAQLLDLSNTDENKVFGVTFKTPADEATGVAHILEHSVLCGSRKYRVKEPFVELLKGSLQTFLNAFTYPDKTCYPVASCNLRDFRNLVDVYLDAVFHPHLTEAVFQQEAWHVAADQADGPWSFKGVVYNEMKGVYSSPDSMLAEDVQHAVFPDTQYGRDSGGDPQVIPDLTFERFMDFHRTLYHPANARFWFYGDDPADERLAILAAYLDEFEPLDAPLPEVRTQPRLAGPVRVDTAYPAEAGEDGESDAKAHVAVSWLLPEAADPEANLALQMLEHILVELPSSLLRKALMDSGLGEDLAGVGLETELKQMYFSAGLKGTRAEDADRIVDIALEALGDLAGNGVPQDAVDAAVNTVEFDLRENNTGRFPRGLNLMLRSLVSWLHQGDPMAPLAFEAHLAAIKARLAAGEPLFEELIRVHFLDNPHRALVVLTPDPALGEAMRRREAERLERLRQAMGPEERAATVAKAARLRELQERPDDPQALAAIPRLSPGDMETENRPIPLEEGHVGGARLLFHDLDTSGLVYLDTGLSLRPLDGGLLRLAPLFSRALVEMGTARRGFEELSTRIAGRTGGVEPAHLVTAVHGSARAEAWLFLRGKATLDKAGDLADILREVLLEARFDDRERFRQIVLEEKARLEQRLVPAGHMFAALRLRARFHEAGRVEEAMGGVVQLEYLRSLAERMDADWPGVLADLERTRALLLARDNALFNLTVDRAGRDKVLPHLEGLAGDLPGGEAGEADWGLEAPAAMEGLTIPAHVNYVGKGLDLSEAGYAYHGSASAACKLLRAGWLWDRVRVQGGAYGAFCSLDRMSSILTFVSYRDPNVDSTLEAFDHSAAYLRRLDPGSGELDKAVVGAIGELDAHLLPDAKGWASMVRRLAGDNDRLRQRMRAEILETGPADAVAFADAMERAREKACVTVLGSRPALEESGVGPELALRRVL